MSVRRLNHRWLILWTLMLVSACAGQSPPVERAETDPFTRALINAAVERIGHREDPEDYRPGELVTWMLPGNLPHIGLVVNERSGDGERPMIVHNIGSGPEIEDMLFRFEITGHYSYRDTVPGESPSE
jgi:hypothetical protein